MANVVPSCQDNIHKQILDSQLSRGLLLTCFLPQLTMSFSHLRGATLGLPALHTAQKQQSSHSSHRVNLLFSSVSALWLWSKYSQMQFSGVHWLQQAFYLPQMPANEKGLLLLLLIPKTEWQQWLLPIADLTLGKLHFPTPPKEMLDTLFMHVVPYHMRQQAEKRKSQR